MDVAAQLAALARIRECAVLLLFASIVATSVVPWAMPAVGMPCAVLVLAAAILARREVLRRWVPSMALGQGRDLTPGDARRGDYDQPGGVTGDRVLLFAVAGIGCFGLVHTAISLMAVLRPLLFWNETRIAMTAAQPDLVVATVMVGLYTGIIVLGLDAARKWARSLPRRSRSD